MLTYCRGRGGGKLWAHEWEISAGRQVGRNGLLVSFLFF